MFAASHSNYSVQPFMMLLLSALYSVQLHLYNVYSIGVPSCFVFTAAYLCAVSHNAVLFLLLPCFSAQHTLLLTRYANFVYLGFRRSLAYLHLSAASLPSSVAIGGNCVCVLSSLVCNLYRLLVASLMAGLNNVPITENSP